MIDMNSLDQLRRETGAFVKNHVDRFAVVMQGQPRYVGNKNWVDETVGFYRDTKEQFPDIPLDMFFVVNTWDTFNKELVDLEWYDIHQTGFPSVEYRDQGLHTTLRNRFYNLGRELYYIDKEQLRCYGKIPVKKIVFEDYMRQVFNFADTVNFFWIDPYVISNNIDSAYNEATPELEMFMEHGHGWKMQNFVLKYVYEEYKHYFDNVLTENSVVYKTRFDLSYVYFQKNSRKHPTNLGNTATVLHQFKYNIGADNDIIENPSYHRLLLNPIERLLNTPRIVIQANDMKIIRGNVFSTDFAYTMDRQAFVDYATKYWDWMVNRAEDLQYIGQLDPSIDPILFKYKTKPECQTNKFFLENEFTIYSLFADDLYWLHPYNAYSIDYPRSEVELYRRTYPEEWDLHRLHFYDWDLDVVNEFFIIDETGIDVELCIP